MGPGTGRTQTQASAEATAAPERGDLQSQFAAALNVGWFEGLTSSPQEIIAAREPNEIIDAFAEVRPDWKPVMDEIKKDPELATALHGALSKDETMLDGFAEMVDNGSGQTTPAELANTLKDKQARSAMTFALNKIGNEDKYKFEDFKKLMEGNREQQVAQLGEMGYNPMMGMDIQDILGMVQQFCRDPMGTMNQMADMFCTGPAQREAIQPMIDTAGTMFGVALGKIHGEEKGYGDRIADALGAANEAVNDGSITRFMDDISGKTDTEVAAQREQAGQGNTNIAPDSFGSNVQMGQNGSLGRPYDTAASGATPERAPAAPAPTPPRQEPALAQ